MHYSQHNKLTSALTRKRRTLESIRARHALKANTSQDPDGKHRRMVKHYDRELLRLGVVA